MGGALSLGGTLLQKDVNEEATKKTAGKVRNARKGKRKQKNMNFIFKKNPRHIKLYLMKQKGRS